MTVAIVLFVAASLHMWMIMYNNAYNLSKNQFSEKTNRHVY